MNPIRRFFLLLGLTMGCLTAGSLRAQLLWPGTIAGMSVEDVQKAFPEAQAPAESAAVQLPNGRGIELLMLERTVIADHAFRVRFFFNPDRQLVVVALSDSGEIPAKEFERFRDLLRAKYGMEYSTRSSDHVEITWKAVQTVILLSWVPQGRGSATLSISYEAPIVKETNRL